MFIYVGFVNRLHVDHYLILTWLYIYIYILYIYVMYHGVATACTVRMQEVQLVYDATV